MKEKLFKLDSNKLVALTVSWNFFIILALFQYLFFNQGNEYEFIKNSFFANIATIIATFSLVLFFIFISFCLAKWKEKNGPFLYDLNLKEPLKTKQEPDHLQTIIYLVNWIEKIIDILMSILVPFLVAIFVLNGNDTNLDQINIYTSYLILALMPTYIVIKSWDLLRYVVGVPCLIIHFIYYNITSIYNSVRIKYLDKKED